ncbi:cupin [Bacillus sp. AFS018417]|uniref:quercetin 2,3-dioxygenase n=1 Tax=Bacillus sp. AFS018417 TaxID=2033491 RepID=UPI000BF97321|nr:quercetin 2,3-dioxygenase [Bacillus sp. AFS018417]PEZ09269.1 cupin [Bacillus sp. AFS018417]
MSVDKQNKVKIMHRNTHENNTYLFLNSLASILVSGEDTNGEFCVIHTSSKKSDGPPLHVHEKEDETFFVLEGEITFFVGDEIISAKAGDYVFAPRGIPHTLKVTSDTAKCLVTAYPSGFDSFIKDLGVPYRDGMKIPEGPPPLEVLQKLIKTSEKYNISYPNLTL